MICTICARAGSKGVANKNIRPIAGRPLIAHTIVQALESQLFEHVVVSTDSDDISAIAVQFGAEILFKRPDELAGDRAAKLPVIRHAFLETEKYYQRQFDYLIDLDATSPLRSVEDIKACVDLVRSGSCSNVITAAPSRRSPYFNLIERDESGKWAPAKSLKQAVVRRQDAPACYDMNASIYGWTRECILNDNSLFLDGTALHVMPEDRSVDIDSPLDFRLVEMMLKERGEHAEG